MTNLPDPLSYELRSPAQQHGGVRAGLIASGVILICIGAVFACMGGAIPLSLLVPRPAQIPDRTHLARMMVGAIVLYLSMAALMIWIAIGAIRCQRWVRPIMIILSALTLLTGLGTTVFWTFFYGDLSRQMNQSGGTPAGFVPVFFGIMLLFFFAALILLPAGFLWFFARAKVEEALRALDPSPRWTDGVPLPALAITVSLGLYGLSLVETACFAIAPQWGIVLIGFPAVAMLLIEGLLAIAIARGTLRRSSASWWAALGYLILYCIATGSTAIRSDKLALYRRAGYPAAELKQMEQMSSLQGPAMPILLLIFALLAAGYLVYAKRFFGSRAQEN